MNLNDILIQRAKNNKLAHFYLIESPAPEEQSFVSLISFVHHFIRQYYRLVEEHPRKMDHLMDHPDVYVLGNLPQTQERGEKFFTVEDCENLARFFEFKSVEAKRKFAIVTEGHRINSMVANKWLKLLEEPLENCTIFILNPRGNKLLDTIHSRAQHLRLSPDKMTFSQGVWENFVQESKTLTLSQFLEKNNKSVQDVSFWTNETIRWEAQMFDNAEHKLALTRWIKKLEELDTFHQPSATKWTLFHAYLCEHVFNRPSH
jgi:hypothetical protein